MWDSPSNLHQNVYYCKKCTKIRQELSTQRNTSDDGGYQKVMPMSVPTAIIPSKLKEATLTPFTLVFNSREEYENWTTREKNFRRNLVEVGKTEMLKIESCEEEGSSISYEPIETKRISSTEGPMEVNIDFYISDVLTKSLKDLPEGGGLEPDKVESQFIEYRSNKSCSQKIESIPSSIDFDTSDISKLQNNNSLDKSSNSSFDDHMLNQEKLSEMVKVFTCEDETMNKKSHCVLDTQSLEKLNSDTVKISFGSAYYDNSTENVTITRNLSKVHRSDSLEVQPSSTNESSCSGSDENLNVANFLRDAKVISEETNLKEIHSTTDKTGRRKTVLDFQQDTKDIPVEQVKLGKGKSKKKAKILVHNKDSSSSERTHQNIPQKCTHTCNHEKKTPKEKCIPSKMKDSQREKKPKSSQPPSKGAIKKMTIFQTQSDIITPDNENGPRRFYQKTEINDGGKRIEILEIVECADNCRSSSSDRSWKIGKCHKINSEVAKKSVSPIPIQHVKTTLCLPSSPTIIEKALPKSNSELSKETENHAVSSPSHPIYRKMKDEMTQTISSTNSSPNCIVCRHQEKIPKYFMENQICSTTIRSPGSVVRRRGTPGRSSDSMRYQRVFEDIPEEKSSLSTDSSSEENKSSSKERSTGEHAINSRKSDTDTASETINETTKKSVVSSNPISTSSDTNVPSESCTDSVTKIMKDQCPLKMFERSYEQSFLDEDEPVTQSECSNQYTITSPSTITAIAGSATPKNVSTATFPTSSESCNTTCPVEGLAVSFGHSSTSETTSSTLTTDSNIILGRKALDHEKPEDYQQITKPMSDSPKQDSLSYNNLRFPCVSKSDYTWRVDASCSDDSKMAYTNSSYASPMSTSSLPQTPIVSLPKDCFNKCSSKDLSQCSRCCFCNPHLHESSEYYDSSNCLYCNRKRTPKLEEAETNTECDVFCRNNPCSIPFHSCTATSSSDRTLTKCTQTELITKIRIPNTIKVKGRSEHKKFSKNIKKSEFSQKTCHLQSKHSSQKTTCKFQSNLEVKLPRTDYQDSCCESTLSSTSDSLELAAPLLPRGNPSLEERRDIGTQKSPDILEERNDCQNKLNVETEKDNFPSRQQKSPGWSVTVTGSSQDLVPDVEMKLKFPKPCPLLQIQKEKEIPEPNAEGITDDSSRKDNLLLPTTKKSLTRATPDTSRSQFENKFPKVSSLQQQQADRNFALSSATGVISKHGRGRRAMSYHHVISTHSGMEQGGRNCHVQHNYLELDDPINNHRMSLSYHQQSLAAKPLTVTGNAIEPEQKPRVPTMSEKDLTRKHKDSNFTRNRLSYV